MCVFLLPVTCSLCFHSSPWGSPVPCFSPGLRPACPLRDVFILRCVAFLSASIFIHNLYQRYKNKHRTGASTPLLGSSMSHPMHVRFQSTTSSIHLIRHIQTKHQHFDAMNWLATNASNCTMF